MGSDDEQRSKNLKVLLSGSDTRNGECVDSVVRGAMRLQYLKVNDLKRDMRVQNIVKHLNQKGIEKSTKSDLDEPICRNFLSFPNNDKVQTCQGESVGRVGTRKEGGGLTRLRRGKPDGVQRRTQAKL